MYREDEIISMWSADMYDLDETDITDVNFAMSIIGPFSKRILEIGCGSGRYLASLAKAGHKVVGLDSDEFMLKKIDAKLEDKNNAEWRKSSLILFLIWSETVDLTVYCRKLVCNPLKLHGKISLLFITQNDII